MDYRWRFNPPGKKLTVHIENHQTGTKRFDATLSLKRQEISSIALASMLSTYPFMILLMNGLVVRADSQRGETTHYLGQAFVLASHQLVYTEEFKERLA